MGTAIVSLGPSRERGEGSESAVSIASQAESAAAVIARDLRLVRKEILAEEKVEVAVAIDVADADGQGRGHLGFDGKGSGFEMIATIEGEG